MLSERVLRILAASAIVPAGATLNFLLFWSFFDFWRRHRALTYVMMLGDLALIGVLLYVFRRLVFAARIDAPVILQALGWALIVASGVLGFVADRQIGIRVRSFTPFFEEQGRIRLVTSGAYGVVRHPIYAAGLYYQLGATFVTGYVAVAAAFVVLALGAAWFTRREEERLVGLLEDRDAYDRYRARVPALFPWPRRR